MTVRTFLITKLFDALHASYKTQCHEMFIFASWGTFSSVRFSGREEGCYYTILISYLISAVLFESDKLRVLECYWRWQKIDKNVLVGAALSDVLISR